jgi:GT2 family glycosyltransferase/glycosyltransferase involved in cell wall biosynthesis
VKILIVVHGWSPAATGGTEIHAEALARALVAAGHEVTVLTREGEPSLPEYRVRSERRDGIDLVFVNNNWTEIRSTEEGWRPPAIGRIAARLLDRLRPDRMHVEHLTGLTTDLVLLAAARGIPTTVTLHDFWMLCHRGQLLDRELAPCAGPTPDGCARCLGETAAAGPVPRSLLRRLPPSLLRMAARVATGAAGRLLFSPAAKGAAAARMEAMRQAIGAASIVFAPSRALADRFAANGFPKTRLLSLGIEREAIERATAGGRRASSLPIRIGFLGSLMVSKGAHDLLEAFGTLPPGSATLDLLGDVVPYHGDDSYRARLGALLRIPGVRPRGWLSRGEIPPLLASLDLVVVPSTWPENSPLVVREAFAAGIPVVGSRIGGIPEAIRDGVDGLLFEPGNPRELAAILRDLVDDPARIDRLRGAIRPPRAIAEEAAELIEAWQCLPSPPRRAATTAPPPRLAAVVINHRTPGETILALRALAASRRPVDLRIVVENGSGDDSERRIREADPEALVIASPDNLGFSGGANLGIEAALGRGADRILLVNSDVHLPPTTIGRLEAALEADPGAALAAPRLLSRSFPDLVASEGIAVRTTSGRVHHLGYGRRVSPALPPPPLRVDALSGCVLLAKRELFDTIGRFDERLFFSFEDIDLCLRARAAGFGLLLVPEATALHEGSLSIGPRSPRKIYYASRNHLLVSFRSMPASGPLHRSLRAVVVLGLNFLHAALSSGLPRRASLAAFLRGSADGLRGRGGAAPDSGDNDPRRP